ncbi:hypothetical protein [Aurantimonas endophytica]|uniref:Uncharacterized protein n=1 Tax=Aurantimonas endophytica TaxID=1522175 RepID=A0A7W6HBY5_9HYPH|nr:hypothetical protein [Aurantimonas endophytica]MBB4002364.1 hypothetical protein [Aurantimonas endophytica]MCO6402013.1 hypothetical protein [Aurantimonas endophytica]
MTLRPLALTALLLAAGLGLAACDEPAVQPSEVGSGDGPTGGDGSANPAVDTSGDPDAEGVVPAEQDPQ